MITNLQGAVNTFGKTASLKKGELNSFVVCFDRPEEMFQLLINGFFNPDVKSVTISCGLSTACGLSPTFSTSLHDANQRLGLIHHEQPPRVQNEIHTLLYRDTRRRKGKRLRLGCR